MHPKTVRERWIAVLVWREGRTENRTFHVRRVDHDDVLRQQDWRFFALSGIGPLLGFGVEAEPHMGMAVATVELEAVPGQVRLEASEDVSDLATAGHGHVLQVPQNGDLPKAEVST